jgi:hypothetical protein
MKKFLIFIMLLACSRGAFAQGGLTIDNSNATCGVWVKMYAMDVGLGLNACSLSTNTFYVPAGEIWVFCSVTDIQGPLSACCTTSSSPGASISSPGWFGGFGFPASGPVSFVWTDVTFQFGCTTDCNAGGNMVNSCSPNCLVGPYSSSWTSPALGCVNSGAWTPACLGTMGNLVLTFHS